MNRFPNVLMAVAFIALGGCATTPPTATTVHIFDAHLAPTVAEQLRVEFEAQRFEVVMENEPFPASIRESTLIHSMAHRAPDEITAVRTTASRAGWSQLAARTTRVENHTFTRDHVGLYLLPPGIRLPPATASGTPATEFVGYCGEDDASLSLKPNGNAVMEIYRWHEATTSHLTELRYGQWQEQNAKVTIKWEQDASSWRREKASKQFVDRTVEGERLVSTSEDPCEFERFALSF